MPSVAREIETPKLGKRRRKSSRIRNKETFKGSIITQRKK
jgi:hypothetical protein